MTLKGEKAVSSTEIYKEPEEKYYYAICIHLNICKIHIYIKYLITYTLCTAYHSNSNFFKSA